MKPFIKKYSAEELNSCKLIRVKFATVGLDNPKGNYLCEVNSCKICGAGRKMIVPLHIPTNQMGRKRIDQNQRYGFIVVDVNLIEEIKNKELTGIQDYPIRMGRNESEFRLILIQNTLPQMSNNSQILKNDICPLCQRSGHYDYYDIESRFKYQNMPEDSWEDFNLTWEYFGIWDMGNTSQELVVSKRAYEFLRDLRLGHLKFEPVDLINGC